MATNSSRKTKSGSKTTSASSASKSDSLTWTAVALQDHLVRSLSLEDPLSRNRTVASKKFIKKPKAISKIDTGRKREIMKKDLINSVSAEDKEYVLDSTHQPLSLAQKFGIIDVPNKALTEEEWANVKCRSNEREDSSRPCPICQERFGNQQQVCLESFEKFSGKRTCPMCRKVEYQKRVIFEGSKINKIKSIVKIQSLWRGYVVRKWYQNLRKTVPPKDSLLRRNFYEAKLQEITDRMVSSVDKDVDAFLAEIDSSVAASRKIMEFADVKQKQLTDSEWSNIQMQAIERDILDCPICMMPLKSCESTQCIINKSGKKELVILSCSHVFHWVCLEAFEEFSIQTTKLCPVCRSYYTKRRFDYL